LLCKRDALSSSPSLTLKKKKDGHQFLTPVIIATLDAEIRRILIQGQLVQKNKTHLNTQHKS
jgi:hypothetical protein